MDGFRMTLWGPYRQLHRHLQHSTSSIISVTNPTNSYCSAYVSSVSSSPAQSNADIASSYLFLSRHNKFLNHCTHIIAILC
mmetsp:Transcript_24349/g.40645  ORF Transcript_24349/g.40645 Transcript_24349/m.40645 type:complete len:81 (+) Transcript_24349:102-344(+)